MQLKRYRRVRSCTQRECASTWQGRWRRQVTGLSCGESVFGSTSYPFVSMSGGRTYNVHGLRLNSDGSVSAVIAYPAGEEVTGVRTYTPQEADKVVSPARQMCVGTPEEWDILGDCFVSAMQVEKAETREEQPLPWW